MILQICLVVLLAVLTWSHLLIYHLGEVRASKKVEAEWKACNKRIYAAWDNERLLVIAQMKEYQEILSAYRQSLELYGEAVN